MSASVRVGLFEIDPVLAVGVHHGFFSEQGISLEWEQVTSSDAQFSDLASGRYQFIQTAFDNVANYALNVSNHLGRRIDVAAFLPIDHGMGLALVGRPGMDDTGLLRGKVVSVDSPTSGYAYIVYALLEQAGLSSREDCRIVPRGAADRRLDDLLAGGADATLLTNELSVSATAHGCHILGMVAQVCDPYLSSVLAASRARADHDSLMRVEAAYLAARDYTLDPSHRDDVVAAMVTVKKISTPSATGLLTAALGDGGLVRTSTFETDAVRNTLLLRQRFDGFDTARDVDSLIAPGSPLLFDPAGPGD